MEAVGVDGKASSTRRTGKEIVEGAGAERNLRDREEERFGGRSWPLVMWR
jgi:hypothetical protein